MQWWIDAHRLLAKYFAKLINIKQISIDAITMHYFEINRFRCGIAGRIVDYFFVFLFHCRGFCYQSIELACKHSMKRKLQSIVKQKHTKHSTAHACCWSIKSRILSLYDQQMFYSIIIHRALVFLRIPTKKRLKHGGFQIHFVRRSNGVNRSVVNVHNNNKTAKKRLKTKNAKIDVKKIKSN